MSTTTTTRTQHTPGPFTIQLRQHVGALLAVVDSKGRRIATFHGEACGIESLETADNARLFAAAPELLAVARMIVSFARNTRENAESTNLLFSAADAARAAIAKAEGAL